MRISRVPWDLVALVGVATTVFLVWGAMYSQGTWWYIPLPMWLPFPLLYLVWQFWRWSPIWGLWVIAFLLPSVLKRATVYVKIGEPSRAVRTVPVALGVATLVILEALVLGLFQVTWVALIVFPVLPLTVGLFMRAVWNMRQAGKTGGMEPVAGHVSQAGY